MDSLEIKKEFAMSYQELIGYLLKKYGAAKYDYFVNESCKSKNKKAMRTSEGLFCHHIDEDKAIMLSHDEWATKNPFSYQKADRLVYCNFLEHFMLHIKIAEEPRADGANEHELPGVGGAVNLICRQLNDFYGGYEFKQTWMITALGLVKENFDDYIMLLHHLWQVVLQNEIYAGMFTLEFLCVGWDGHIVKRVYDLM